MKKFCLTLIFIFSFLFTVYGGTAFSYGTTIEMTGSFNIWAGLNHEKDDYTCILSVNEPTYKFEDYHYCVKKGTEVVIDKCTPRVNNTGFGLSYWDWKLLYVNGSVCNGNSFIVNEKQNFHIK